MAKLYFRYGAMNSGKSTGLLQAAFNYEERGQRVLLAKPAVDTKGEDEILSRLGVSRRVDFLIPPGAGLRALFRRHAEADPQGTLLEGLGEDAARLRSEPVSCLLVDEAQFLAPEQVDDLLRIAVLDGVAGAGLRHPHRLPHPGLPRIGAADGPGPCAGGAQDHLRCGRKAVFTPAGWGRRSSSTATRSRSTALR